MLDRVAGRLFAAADVAPLVLFRIAFGTIALWEMRRYFDRGWITRYYVDPPTHFTYYGFEWVWPWPGQWMYIHFAILGLLAACIAVGACYRVATALFCLGFSYVFLLEQARYLNHLYLVCLLSFLLCVVAALAFLPPDWPRRVTGLTSPPGPLSGAERGSSSRVVLAFLAVYVAVQLLVPLRHLLYPGDVAWTEEGHRFSWRMRLREKEQSIELRVT